MAFRLTEYKKLLENLAEFGRPFRTVESFLSAPDKKSIVLRHDVDRMVKRSVAMARLEHENNIAASYYFRYRNGLPKNALLEINAMGHEVGFHYETLSDAKGEPHIALDMFLEQLDKFRLIADCQTICAHGRPLSRWFSGDMAGTFLVAANKLIGDASESMPSDMLIYLTDTGGKWNHPTVNLRDRVGDMQAGINPLNKKSLSRILEEEKSLYVSTHPERWCNNSIDLAAQSSLDIVANLIKRLLRKTRNYE